MTKILIIEDQPDIRSLITMTLQSEDHEIVEADDADSGWKRLLEQRPDIVLLDIMMPGDVDGLQLCRRIRQDERLAHTRIVLVSARGHRNDMQIGLEAGADDYLLKPFSPLRLLDLVDDLSAAA